LQLDNRVFQELNNWFAGEGERKEKLAKRLSLFSTVLKILSDEGKIAFVLDRSNDSSKLDLARRYRQLDHSSLCDLCSKCGAGDRR
jgi:hypothetical protein